MQEALFHGVGLLDSATPLEKVVQVSVPELEGVGIDTSRVDGFWLPSPREVVQFLSC
ncbi:hypothetical protein Poly41_50660 [Novipirellula artificiosorum]|uniref:Uncharacterized protein n=1 Tax=Novipirellula artificiosorum TaxID=2528016 RepID=A0A5C6D7Z4_9BACT|nr:hypothetical protein Poly41_50660 [Novipirellula artificiosorum]